MELKEFVKDAILQLDSAIDEANNQTKREVRFKSSDNRRTLEFDVAVTVEDKSSKGGKAGIKVLGLTAGGGGGKESKNVYVSRVQFGVKISSTTKVEDQERSARNQAQFSKTSNNRAR
jgi:hypothetical protein